MLALTYKGKEKMLMHIKVQWHTHQQSPHRYHWVIIFLKQEPETSFPIAKRNNQFNKNSETSIYAFAFFH